MSEFQILDLVFILFFLFYFIFLIFSFYFLYLDLAKELWYDSYK